MNAKKERDEKDRAAKKARQQALFARRKAARERKAAAEASPAAAAAPSAEKEL
jgi:hypothetical protein